MDSITKNGRSPEQLRQMVERAFGREQLPAGDAAWLEELGFGMFNAAYRLSLRDGTDVVLKVAPPPAVEVMTYEIGALAVELETLRLIRAHTSVPVPEVLSADTSRTICDSDYFFMTHLAGENLAVADERLPADRRDAYGRQLGALNREINSVVGPGFGPVIGAGGRSWPEVFTRMVEEVLVDGERRDVDLGRPPDLIRQTLDDHAGVLDGVVEPRLVEWDLWRGNVLIRDDRIVGILDHERAFWGDPLMEHGFNGLVQPDFGDPAAFVQGYGWSPTAAEELTRRQLYGIHLALIMIVETDYRSYPDDAQYRWARHQLDEVMTQLAHR